MTNPTPPGQVPDALRLADWLDGCGGLTSKSCAAELRRLHVENAALRTAHVQNPAEIEHVAGDVSKNGAEVNTMDLIDAYAEARHIGGCHTYNAKTAEARAKVVAVLRTQQPAPATQQAGVALSDDLRDRLVAISEAVADQDDRAAQAMLREILAAPQPSPTPQANSAPSAASKAVLAAIRAANMQLVRTGDDSFMLVTYKQATPQADSQPAPVLDRDRIREIFMAHGFTVKEGQTDLKQYVYDAADALLRAARAPADSGAAPAGWKLVPIEPSVDQEWEGKEASSRVSTMAEACKIYKAMLAAAPTPPAQAADSVLEDAARWRALPAFFEEYQIDAMKLYRDIDAYLDAARKQGANLD